MNPKIIELIRMCKIQLFTKELLFFGMNANKFDWSVESMHPAIEGFVLFNEDDLTKLEAGKIHINENFLLKPDYTYSNLSFIICHELGHILNRHGLRRGNRKPEYWNVACDHVLEIWLRDNLKVKPYNNQYNIIPRLESDKPRCTAEMAYDWLMSNTHKIKINLQLDPNGNGQDLIEVTDSDGNEMFIIPASMGGVNSENEDSSKVQYQTNQFISESRAIFESLKAKGNLSSSLQSYLNELLKVELPWDKIIEKAIKTNTIMKPDDRNWTNLNKYFIPHNLTLPGYALIEDQEGTGILIILVDDSGSISDKNLKKFSYIIESSMKFFKEIHVFIHDVNIQQRKIFDKDNILYFHEFIKNEGYRGRGGTSHKFVFDVVEKEYWDDKKDDLSMVISLTDMFSDIEYTYKNYKWIKNNIPLLFVITEDGKKISVDEKFGDITQIQMGN